MLVLACMPQSLRERGYILYYEVSSHMAALSKHIPSRMNPVFAESVAALNAVIFPCDCGFLDVEFEGDALTAIKIISSNDNFAGPYGHIIYDIRRESSCFRSCN